jgi:hypothetical protein
MTIESAEVELVDYKGRVYRQFHARRDPSHGPGWYVFGRNEGYGDRLVMCCARPAVKARRHPHYNGLVRRGWRTMREARAIAEDMNRRYGATEESATG